MILNRCPTMMRIAMRQISNISFRTAVKSDIPQLCQWNKIIYESLFEFNEEVFCNEMDVAMCSTKPWFLTHIYEAKDNGNTCKVGMASFFPTYAPYCTPSAFEHGFYVVPEWRRKGISSIMIHNMNKMYSDEGIQHAYGLQLVSNTIGRKASDKVDYNDATTSRGLHTMFIDLKEKTFCKQKCNTNIRVRPAEFEDCVSMCNLLQDPKSQQIGVMPISVTTEKLQRHGFPNTGRQYFEAIVVIDPTKSDAFGNELVVGCAVYTKGLIHFAGKVLNVTSISVNSEYSDMNVDMLLWQEMEKVKVIRLS